MKGKLTGETVKQYGIEAGAKVVGIAAAADFTKVPEGFAPGDLLEGCRSVIVLGAPLPKEAILGNPIGFIDIRNALNERMNDAAKSVAKQIKRDGCKSLVVAGMSGKWVNGKMHGHISLKHAAELAGLGVIGKNYLLNNPEYGNILWFSAVLTDAELEPDKKSCHEICKKCNKCVTACPVNALDNPAAFDKEKCAKTMFKMIDKKMEIMCFACRTACPHCFGKR